MKKNLLILIPILAFASLLFTSSCDGYDVTIDYPPEIELLSPSEDATFHSTDSILFHIIARDPGNGGIGGDAIVWTSDKDGFMSNGLKFRRKLSVNTHNIEIVATDAMNNWTTFTFTLNIIP